MKKTSTAKILKSAEKLKKEGRSWHFHILTPECVFNDTNKFALVLENSSDEKVFVNYSDKKQEVEGKELLELLHGIKADEFKKFATGNPTPPIVVKMIDRAKELIDKQVSWHHHALFPGCIFNKTKNKWVVMLEDPETGGVLESVTEERPDADLQLIEPLFYNQKK